jgi:hypothetical protein
MNRKLLTVLLIALAGLGALALVAALVLIA